MLLSHGAYGAESGSFSVMGKIKASTNCGKRGQLFVSKGSTLLYQFDIAVGSTYSVSLKKGQYNFAVLTEKLCEAKSTTSIERDQRLNFEPKMESK